MFKGKVVYYLVMTLNGVTLQNIFSELTNLVKKLISTSYAPNSKLITSNYQPSLFESNNPKFDQEKTLSKGKIFILEKDKIRITVLIK